MAQSQAVQRQVFQIRYIQETLQLGFLPLGRVLKYLEGMSGRQVLGMKREALETAFGKEEGGRLDSQITLSR